MGNRKQWSVVSDQFPALAGRNRCGRFDLDPAEGKNKGNRRSFDSLRCASVAQDDGS
jgi:hypothetical protein